MENNYINKPSLDLFLRKILVMILIAYAWDQSGLQILNYLPELTQDFLRLISIISIIFGLGMIVNLKIISHIKAHKEYFYILISCFALSIFQSNPQFELLFFIKGLAYFFITKIIIADRELIKFTLKVNFYIITLMCILNIVTVLHWMDFVWLQNENLVRIGGDAGQHLDPISFGIFGMTENYVYPNGLIGIPRLQGFSSEPLHWGYFILMAYLNGLLLIRITKECNKKRIVRSLILVLPLGAYLTQSITMYISIFLIFATLIIKMAMPINRLSAYYIIAILSHSLLIPLALILGFNDILEIFNNENFLNKTTNLYNKIDYLTLTYTELFQLLPNLDNKIIASHNLILSWYFSGGVFLAFLFYKFWWVVWKKINIIKGRIVTQDLHIVIVLVAMYTMQNESAFFYPSGVLSIIVAHNILSERQDRIRRHGKC